MVVLAVRCSGQPSGTKAGGQADQPDGPNRPHILTNRPASKAQTRAPADRRAGRDRRAADRGAPSWRPSWRPGPGRQVRCLVSELVTPSRAKFAGSARPGRVTASQRRSVGVGSPEKIMRRSVSRHTCSLSLRGGVVLSGLIGEGRGRNKTVVRVAGSGPPWGAYRIASRVSVTRRTRAHSQTRTHTRTHTHAEKERSRCAAVHLWRSLAGWHLRRAGWNRLFVSFAAARGYTRLRHRGRNAVIASRSRHLPAPRHTTLPRTRLRNARGALLRHWCVENNSKISNAIAR